LTEKLELVTKKAFEEAIPNKKRGTKKKKTYWTAVLDKLKRKTKAARRS